MNELTQPTRNDLIDCLKTLTQFEDARHIPDSHIDLYYHARNLADELDESDSGRDGLAALVKHRAFERAIEMAQSNAHTQQY